MGRGGIPVPKPYPKGFDRLQAKREADKADRALKAEIKQRDGYQCRCCGRKDSLEVHERKTRGAGGIVSRENSLTLCRLCHQLAQQYRIEIDGDSCDGPLKFYMSFHVSELVFRHRGVMPLHCYLS